MNKRLVATEWKREREMEVSIRHCNANCIYVNIQIELFIYLFIYENIRLFLFVSLSPLNWCVHHTLSCCCLCVYLLFCCVVLIRTLKFLFLFVVKVSFYARNMEIETRVCFFFLSLSLSQVTNIERNMKRTKERAIIKKQQQRQQNKFIELFLFYSKIKSVVNVYVKREM